MNRTQQIEKAYAIAKEVYSEIGVDTEKALKRAASVPISLHCWQGDDVAGFESAGAGISDGGIQATGNYPGKARNPEELRADYEKAFSMIPGKKRINVHAIYAETGGKKIPRNELAPEHFSNWIAWAKKNRMGMDFNPTFFSHPLAADGLTLSHPDKSIRKFWVEHGIACRKIGESIGKQLGTACVTNVWIPDGYKDVPADRKGPRVRLKESLDAMFAKGISPKYNLDAVEPKLFGIGSESYVVGSHEFYLCYAAQNSKLICLDTGHYHPTETVADKLSSVLTFIDEVLLHISRGVRWDSDHVVTSTDDLKAICDELVRGDYLDRVHIGLDYFDASINRIAAWTIGARNTAKNLLYAMLEPVDALRSMEIKKDYTGRLACLEELKSMPANAVWDYYCLKSGVPCGLAWLDEARKYEKNVLSKRK